MCRRQGLRWKVIVIRFRISLLALLSIILAACGTGARQAGKVTTRRNASTVGGHRLWVASIQPNADSSPAYLPVVNLPGNRKRAMVYVLAGNNGSNCNPGDPVRHAITYAFDAANGHLIWSRATSGPSRCTTAGPTVDPSGRWVYVVGLDGKVHRYAAGTGRETAGHGWPVTYTLLPDVEKVASTPVAADGYLYVSTSGFIGDAGHYQGHLVAINLRTARTAVFNSLCSNIRQLLTSNPSHANYCSDVRSGMFGRGQAAIDPLTHDVYAVTGNGPWNGRTNWGDSIVKLDSSGVHLLDTYTPADQAYLNGNDLDLGSTGPAILPPVHVNGRVYHLLVQGGKGPACPSCGPAVLRLLNRDHLSGRPGTGHLGGDLQTLPEPGGCEVLTAPAVWHDRAHGIWVIYANDCGIAGYRVMTRGKPQLRRVWAVSHGGTTPVVHGGILWVARNGEIAAYRPYNGSLLWRTTAIGQLHWEYPLVAGHRLFMTDESGHLSAYAITG